MICLMFCRIINFEFLGVPEFSHDFIESFTSFIDSRTKIIVFRGERRTEFENRVRGSFTNGDFRAIKVKSGAMFFFFLFYTHCRQL